MGRTDTVTAPATSTTPNFDANLVAKGPQPRVPQLVAMIDPDRDTPQEVAEHYQGKLNEATEKANEKITALRKKYDPLIGAAVEDAVLGESGAMEKRRKAVKTAATEFNDKLDGFKSSLDDAGKVKWDAIDAAAKDMLQTIKANGGKPVENAELQREYREKLAEAIGVKASDIPMPPSGTPFDENAVREMARQAKFKMAQGAMQQVSERQFLRMAALGYLGEKGEAIKFNSAIPKEARDSLSKIPDLKAKRDEIIEKYAERGWYTLSNIDEITPPITKDDKAVMDLVVASNNLYGASEALEEAQKKVRIQGQQVMQNNPTVQAIVKRAQAEHKVVAEEFGRERQRIVTAAQAEMAAVQRNAQARVGQIAVKGNAARTAYKGPLALEQLKRLDISQVVEALSTTGQAHDGTKEGRIKYFSGLISYTEGGSKFNWTAQGISAAERSKRWAAAKEAYEAAVPVMEAERDLYQLSNGTRTDFFGTQAPTDLKREAQILRAFIGGTPPR